MPWFRVDDQFSFHPKAIAAGNAALGLWVRAGSWCAAHLTQGALPQHMLGTLGAQKRDAEKLIAVGLWTPVGAGSSHQLHISSTSAPHQLHTSGTQARSTDGDENCSLCEGEPGYQFKDWAQYQLTKEQVEAERESNRARQQAWRDRHRNGGSNGVTDGVTNGVTNGTLTVPTQVTTSPAPPRPDVDELCEHLLRCIRDNDPKSTAKINKAWRDDARRLLDRDGRDLAEAHRLIDWCQSDPFWRTNILGMPKFRAQYSQLLLKAGSSSNGHAPVVDDRPVYRSGAEVRAAREAYEASEHRRYEELMARKAARS